tara:strand:+ start:43 stop:270 length:228 start_codon:yes stop_codon:yes gene_type:complete
MELSTIVTAIEALEIRLENHCDIVVRSAVHEDADFVEGLISTGDYEDDFEKEYLEEIVAMKRALTELYQARKEVA